MVKNIGLKINHRYYRDKDYLTDQHRSSLLFPSF